MPPARHTPHCCQGRGRGEHPSLPHAVYTMSHLQRLPHTTGAGVRWGDGIEQNNACRMRMTVRVRSKRTAEGHSPSCCSGSVAVVCSVPFPPSPLPPTRTHVLRQLRTTATSSA